MMDAGSVVDGTLRRLLKVAARLRDRDGAGTLRGKRLHPDMERRVLRPYRAGLFEEALVDAFKVLEERLRRATDTVGNPYAHFIDEAFSSTTGKLIDPNAHRSELEATYNLFRGAVGSFRNPSAHRFTDPDAEQAFDAIVLANRLLLILAEAEERRRGQGATAAGPTIRFEAATGPVPVMLDADGDGEEELIVPTRRQFGPPGVDPIRWSGSEPIEVYEREDEGLRRVEVEDVNNGHEPMWMLRELSLVDVDGDEQGEIACAMDPAGPGAFLLLFKLRNGRYEALSGAHPAEGEQPIKRFPESWVVDVDGDGRLEIVGEPWLYISAERLRRHLPPGTAPEEAQSGRMRLVWKWDGALGRFALVSETLLYLGPRGLPPEEWEEIYARIGEPPR